MMSEFLKPAVSLQEFFNGKIRQALAQQKLTVSGEVEYYLVQLLAHFAQSEKLFTPDESGKPELRALAMRLYDATFDFPRRFYHLKSLGDTALYCAGVFYDGLAYQAVDIGYYISMGGNAYQSLANLSTSTEKPIAEMFTELSERFPELVEILNLCCESEFPGTDHNLLKLLDRYHRTGSEKARQILSEHGIGANALLPTKILQ